MRTTVRTPFRARVASRDPETRLGQSGAHLRGESDPRVNAEGGRVTRCRATSTGPAIPKTGDVETSGRGEEAVRGVNRIGARASFLIGSEPDSLHEVCVGSVSVAPIGALQSDRPRAASDTEP